jgi:hypothetical protein
MLTLSNIDRVYLACGSTDLRKSIDGLAALVQAGFELDPFSSSLFVFCNRQRDKLKMPFLGTQRVLAFLSPLGAWHLSMADGFQGYADRHHASRTTLAA